MSQSLFQRRHYQAIADVLNQIQFDSDPERDRVLAEMTATALAAMFTADNPNFKLLLFYEACGLLR